MKLFIPSTRTFFKLTVLKRLRENVGVDISIHYFFGQGVARN